MKKIPLIERLRTMGQSGWNPIGNEAADAIERLTAKHKNSFEAGWTMYADNSLGPRVPDQMEQAWNHYLEKQYQVHRSRTMEDSGT